jgi:hypothetical protein
MISKSKYLFILIILAFVVYQFYLIGDEFSSTRIIPIQKEIYDSNEKNYLKGYDIENVPYEQFDIKVSPKTFWDYLLLTNENGNLLATVFKIIASLSIAWYIFKLEPDNFFNENHFKWLIWCIGFIAFAFITMDSGYLHTNDFWKSIHYRKASTDIWGNDFYVNTKTNLMVYAYSCILLIVLLRAIFEYNKPATIKFKGEN